MGRYTNGSCITDMQLELKKEIEHAEVDEGHYGTIKLDFNVAQQLQAAGRGKKKQGNQDAAAANINIDDLLTDEGGNGRDYSALFKR